MGSRDRVASYLAGKGLAVDVREFDESTRNSALAAEALGCTVAEIAKSVVFVGPAVFVVVISGDKRVDVGKLGKLAGGDVRVATPEEVREKTGYPIGGVPPFPHSEGVAVLADSSLLRHSQVWAAAGAPNAVFRIEVNELVRLTGGPTRELAG
jgi:prolyl-tRNA editing enzyme YbaK/EbsC (Cys-tRNA(Pro) deacylase)